MASEVDVEAEGLAGDSCEGAGKKKKKKKRNLEYELRRKQKQKIMRKAKLGVDRLEDELLKLNADIEALNRTASGSPIPTLRTDRGSPVAADKELTVRRM
ncbi:hypothetical protein DIPPA_04597 [Diplonema papillatum]|nr:hypothetical protein DIPPA_04597 [Diplonema papillatum]